MIPLLGPVEYWHWWALGGALAIVEALVPGFVFLWLGIAAGLVGCLLWLWPGIGPDFQVLAFAGLSVASVLGWRRWQAAIRRTAISPTSTGAAPSTSAASPFWPSRSPMAAAGSGSAMPAGR